MKDESWLRSRHSRLLNALCAQSQRFNGHYSSKDAGTYTFPADKISVEDPSIYLQNSTPTSKTSILVAKLLMILDVYLDDGIGRDVIKKASDPKLNFNTDKNYWRDYARILKRWLLDAYNNGKNNVDIIAKVSDIITKIRNENWRFGKGSRLAESMATIILPYGSDCKPKAKAPVLEIINKDCFTQLKDGNNAESYIGRHNTGHTLSDSVLSLIVKVILLCSYYSNLPFGNQFREVPSNTDRTRWTTLALQLINSVIVVAVEKPKEAKLAIVREIDRAVDHIRSSKIYGNGSRLADQLAVISSSSGGNSVAYDAEENKNFDGELIQKIDNYCRDLSNEIDFKAQIFCYCLQRGALLLQQCSFIGHSGETLNLILENFTEKYNIINSKHHPERESLCEAIEEKGIGRFMEDIINQCTNVAGGKIVGHFNKQFVELLSTFDIFIRSISSAEPNYMRTTLLTGFYPA